MGLLGRSLRYPLAATCLVMLACSAAGQARLKPPIRSAKDLDAWLADPKRPKVVIRPLPPIRPPVEPVLSAAEEQRIERLIADLARIDSPDYGLSATMSGEAFAPVEGSAEAGAMLLTDHRIQPSAALVELVKLGPRAMAFLLKHLDDATPTRLTIDHKGAFGAMGLAHELELSETNPPEQKLRLARREDAGDPFRKPLESYTVKVGDVCFSIIGQIVGRAYQAVRYQPTAIIIINSPVADPGLAGEVRSIWSSEKPTTSLFRSLLTEFSCRPIYSGLSMDGWDIGGRLQCHAAMRLLYYFPQQAGPLVAERLRSLRVGYGGASRGSASKSEAEWKSWEDQELANGVRTNDFIRAVAWSTDPRVQAEIAGIVRRAHDPDVLAEALRGIASARRKGLQGTVIRALNAADYQGPNQEFWSYGSLLILAAAAQYWGADAKPIFAAYGRSKSPKRLNTICYALLQTPETPRTPAFWDTEILLPMLSDRRRIPGASKMTPRRVCDSAARTLQQRRSALRDLKLDLDMPAEELNRVEAQMGARLRR